MALTFAQFWKGPLDGLTLPREHGADTTISVKLEDDAYALYAREKGEPPIFIGPTKVYRYTFKEMIET